MAMNPKERDLQAKKEGDEDYSKFPKITSSRQWSSYKNPRIVRVSRNFGGKDRHSKVCTVRGLRDRRIRLSVPTAIQLYDLQERLGLSQPSKVVDWLIDATKNEIDMLPPLPMLPGNFNSDVGLSSCRQLVSHESAANPQSSLYHFLAENQRDLGISPTKEGIEINEREQENQEGLGGFVAQLSAQSFLPALSNQSYFPTLPCNSYFPSNLSLSQIGGGYSFSSQTEDQTAAISSNSQLYFCQSATTIPSSIVPSLPSYITSSVENDLRQVNHLQHVQQSSIIPTTLHFISPPMKSFMLNANSKAVHSQENNKDSRNSKSQ